MSEKFKKMVSIGTPLKKNATRVMLLGSGELGKEVAIELSKLGVEIHACDSYPNAPAMQVAQCAHVFNMLDERILTSYIDEIKPDFIVPEVEAIATNALFQAEAKGCNVVPNAKAVSLTMNREGIRRLAAEELNLPTSKYLFASTEKEFIEAVEKIGTPCIVKPIMSSSGKGQSCINNNSGLSIGGAWKKAQVEGRAGAGKVIVEERINFDYEVTLLTVRNRLGTSFCEPIGHKQVDGDYIHSWQPQPMSNDVLEKAKNIAQKITDALGGHGIFGVELFIKGDEVYFSEVSPRPHDTGLVTIITQDQSEFELHTKAFLGLPISEICLLQEGASSVIKTQGKSSLIKYKGLEQVFFEPNTKLRLFGKPNIDGKRRLGVVLAGDKNYSNARIKSEKLSGQIKINFECEKYYKS